MVNEGWEHLVEVDSREFRVRAMGVRLTVLLGLTRELAEYNTAARWLGSVSCEKEKARSGLGSSMDAAKQTLTTRSRPMRN